MPDQRSLAAFEMYREASQRFDYFVTGATGALCAYILQTFKPKRIDYSPYTVELAALLVLIVSVVVGFKLIERKVMVARINTEWLHHQEKLGMWVANFQGGPMINQSTGEVITPARVIEEGPQLQAKPGNPTADVLCPLPGSSPNANPDSNSHWLGNPWLL